MNAARAAQPPTRTRDQRLTATPDGDFVVFPIGMRVNRPHRMDFAKDEDSGHLPAVGS